MGGEKPVEKKNHSVGEYQQGSSYFTNATTPESKAGKPIRLRDYMESDEKDVQDTNHWSVKGFLILLGFAVLYVGYTLNMYVWMELLNQMGDDLLWGYFIAGVLFFGGMIVMVAVMMRGRKEGLWE